MKLALVTGGTRRLGAAIAARLAHDGYALALHSHHAGALEPAVKTAVETAGRPWATFEADLADEAQVTGLIGRVATHFGTTPTCLVNSASLFVESDWASVGFDALARHFAVNVAAPTVLAQQLAAGLAADGRGVVVNILDQRIAAPPIDQAAYTASKLALGAMTAVMARAYAPRVRVNGVAPGLTIATPDYDAAQLERLAAMMPLERLCDPADVADAVAYLVGASAVTAQIVYVDAGARLEAFRRDYVHMGRDGG